MKQNCSLCRNADNPQPIKNFPKQKILSRTKQRYVSRTAIKGNTIDTCLDRFIASWITTHLVCSSCRSTSVSTGVSKNQIPSMKSGTQWSADITLVW